MRLLEQVVAFVVVGSIGLAGGCARTPPPPRVPVPAEGNSDRVRERDPAKPLPRGDRYDAEADAVPGYEDVPLVDQRPPEQREFVEAYRQVGRPRIAVFVNRTLEGRIVPVNDGGPVASIEHTRRASTGVTVESRDRYTREGRFRDEDRERTDRFETKDGGEYRESLDVYLRPGQYDEVDAKAIDYQAIENILTDWIAANGQVTVVSPTMARQRLSDEQVKQLQDGRPQALSEVAQQLGADVLLQVQARPTRQTREGLEIRVIAEAFNTRGGDSLARAVVDVPPPLEKRQINRSTRFLARKLMNDMGAAWRSAPPQGGLEREQRPEARDLDRPAATMPSPRSNSEQE